MGDGNWTWVLFKNSNYSFISKPSLQPLRFIFICIYQSVWVLTLKFKDPQKLEKGITSNCRAPDLGAGNFNNPFEEDQVLLTEPKQTPAPNIVVYKMIKLDQWLNWLNWPVAQ